MAHEAQNAQQQLKFEARVERLINAPAEAVFDAFTSEAAQAEWFAGPEDTLVTLVVDARVGGKWICEFDHAGERYAWEGTFTEVDRPNRFVIETVTVWPDGETFPSRFVVTCEARGAQTFVTVSEFHESERRRDEAMGGVPGMVDIIQRIVEHETASR